MLKILALFAIIGLSLSVTTEGWVGKWKVTAQTGSAYCGEVIPTVGTLVTITNVNSTAMNMTGNSKSDTNTTWELSWGEYNTLYSNCVVGSTGCVLSALESHGNETHAEINFYCSYLASLKLYRGCTLLYVGNGEDEEETEKNFLSQ